VVNGFKPVLRFIERLNELVAERQGILILPVMPGSLTPHEQALLSAECKPLRGLTTTQPEEERAQLAINLEFPKEVYVSELFEFRVILLNFTSQPVFILRIEGCVAGNVSVVTAPKGYEMKEDSLLLNGLRLESQRPQTLIFKCQASTAQVVTLQPRIVYVNSRGRTITQTSPSIVLDVASSRGLQFEREDSAKAFRYLSSAFLQDYVNRRMSMDSAGWRTSMELADGAGIPSSRVYGRGGQAGAALAELLRRRLAETRSFPGHPGRGGVVVKVRANYGNPYVKGELDRLGLKPKE